MVAPSKAQLRVVVVYSVWLLGNITINTYNKFVLSKTRFKQFPVLLTGTNKAIGWLGSVLLMLSASWCLKDSGARKLPPWSKAKVQFARPLVIVHGISTAINLGFNNWWALNFQQLIPEN